MERSGCETFVIMAGNQLKNHEMKNFWNYMSGRQQLRWERICENPSGGDDFPVRNPGAQSSRPGGISHRRPGRNMCGRFVPHTLK